jgi:large subunit ribosomal protein L10
LAVTREQKGELVNELTDAFKGAQAVIITDYRGLPTAELASLRNQLRGMQASYHVAKNTLVVLALQQAGLPIPERLLEGPTAIAFLRADIAGPARTISAFFKDKNLAIKGAIVGQTVYDATGVEQLATLPTREQLYANLVGALQGPAASLVGVLNGALSELVRTLQAKADQGEAGTAPEPVPAA